MKALELNNIIKLENGKKITNSVSFNVEKGEICGLLGINGAGKSTIMKIICGLTNFSKGEIKVFGEKFTRKHLEKLGVLIEYPPIYSNLSAYDNLKCRAILLGIENKRIDEVLKIVKLDNTGKKKVAKFSMGMKQRLGLALAILHNPKILILDEPTNGLDPIGAKELIDLIKDFKNKGVTVLISSHQINEIKKLTDRIVIIDDGKVIFDGNLKENENLEEIFFKTIQGGKY